MSIKKKLILICLVITLIPILLIGTLSFLTARDSLRELTSEALHAVAEFKESEIYLVLEKFKTRTQDFASDGVVRECLEEINRNRSPKGAVVEKLNLHLRENKKTLDEALKFVDVLNPEGRVVASSDPARVGLDESRTDYFIKARNEIYIRDIRPCRDEVPGLTMSAPLASFGRKTGFIGVLVNHFRITMINNILTGELVLNLGAKTQLRGIGKTGETYIVNREKLLITDSLYVPGAAFKMKVDTLPVKQCLEENREAQGNWRDYRGIPVVGASMCLDIGDFKWVVVSEQDEGEAFARVLELRRKIVIVGGLVLCLAVIAALVIAANISHPVQELQKGTELIGSGNLDHKVGTARKDEIGQLSRSFDQMTENLKTVTASRNDLDKTLGQLKTSQAQLVHAEKMSAVGLMTAGVAHELNNPLMGLLNFVQYCMKHTSEDDRRYPVLKDAENEIKRCVDIVKNLLTFSRMEAEGDEAYQLVNCSSVFDRVLKLLSYKVDTRRVRVNRHVEEGTPNIWAKGNSIEQVFLSLSSNALDAMKESEKKELRVDIRPAGPFVRISITDSGAGLAPENAQRIFDPFFTTKPVGEGTGLGLSICHNIVHSHGGEITCESELGKGTTFGVLLPIEKRRDREHG